MELKKLKNNAKWNIYQENKVVKANINNFY